MIGRILAWGTTLLVLVVIMELGLRLVGFAPPVSVTEPDPELGWCNVAGGSFHRSSREYDVRFGFNSLGLRDDEIGARQGRERRILILGDSFVLGYTLDRARHFVDLLEGSLNDRASSGSSFQVLNAGVEGFSTDQELLLLQRLHKKHELVDGPSGDVVVLCMYMNDLYWLDRADYMGTPKPLLPLAQRAGAGAAVELAPGRELESHPRGWLQRNSAIAHTFFSERREPPRVEVPGVGEIYAERGIFLAPLPGYLAPALGRCEATLRAFREYCEGAGLEYLVALIPHKAQVDTRAGGAVALGFPSGITPALERGTSVFTAACERAGIRGPRLLDPLDPQVGTFGQAGGVALYYEHDWHFNPQGSAAFATALLGRLAQEPFALTPGGADGALLSVPPEVAKSLVWPWVLGALWLLLAGAYIATYRDEKPLVAALKVAGLLGAVAILIGGIGALVHLFPPRIAAWLPGAVVLLVLALVAFLARRKIGTIFALFGAFIERGHWYMVPLLVVLLAIGTLLVVAASNPFVAPFIYTLF